MTNGILCLFDIPDLKHQIFYSSPRASKHTPTRCVLNLAGVARSPNHLLTLGYPRSIFLSAYTYHIHPEFCLWGLNYNDVVFHSTLTNLVSYGMVTNFFEFNKHSSKEKIVLCEGAMKILNTPNAGGNSVWSEVVSCEVLSSLCRAVLHKTEMEIEYAPGSKITDYSVKVLNKDIGVSVTRAMKFSKKGDEFTEDDAIHLLNKKLHGVNESTKGVLSQSWDKQILHIWAQHEYISDILWNTYEKLPEDIKSNTFVLVTICKNAEWLFY